MPYLHETPCKASPKAISGRTSYLRVRLEFLRYPHLITTLFNGCVCGPPTPFTVSSSWTWIGHPVSGLQCVKFALLRLAFAPAPCLKHLTSPHTAARRTVLQKVRRHPVTYPKVRQPGSGRLQAQDFRFSFTPLPGSFSPFLHSTLRYRSLSSI